VFYPGHVPAPPGSQPTEGSSANAGGPSILVSLGVSVVQALIGLRNGLTGAGVVLRGGFSPNLDAVSLRMSSLGRNQTVRFRPLTTG
jgi:hypothetical protein